MKANMGRKSKEKGNKNAIGSRVHAKAHRSSPKTKQTTDKTTVKKKSKPNTHKVSHTNGKNNLKSNSKRKRGPMEQVHVQDPQEYDVEPNEEDFEFFEDLGRSKKGSKFLKVLGRADFSKQESIEKKIANADDIIQKFEEKPRKSLHDPDIAKDTETYRVPLLPVKNVEGRVENAQEPQAVPAAKENPIEHPKQKSVGKKDVDNRKSQNIAKEKNLTSQIEVESVEDMKRMIAVHSVTALENPEDKGEDAMNALLLYSKSKEKYVSHLALLSLFKVFKDILPGYQLKPITDDEMNLSKEVRRQHNYETMLLRTYQQYLKLIIQKSRGGSYADKIVACKCISGLLRVQYNFNYRSDLLKSIVPLLGSSIEEIATESLECIQDIFKLDIDGHATLEALQLIADLIRVKECKLNGRVVDSMQHIKLSNNLAYELGQAEEMDNEVVSRKEKHRRALERRRQRDKALSEGKDVDFHLGSATQSVKEKMKVQSKILEAMFECLFRSLKSFTNKLYAIGGSKSFQWSLLSSTLWCVAKYSIYINIDFMGDLFDSLYQIADAEATPIAQKFMSVHTVYKILEGPGRALNVDVQRFDALLFDILLKEIHLSSSKENEEVGILNDQRSACARAIEMALLLRRVIDRRRTVNFAKRVSLCSLHKPMCEDALSYMYLQGRLLQKYTSARQLLENDEICTIYNYGDLSGTIDLNGSNTPPLWETSLMIKHYHPTVAGLSSILVGKDLPDAYKTSSILNVHDVQQIFEDFRSFEGSFKPAPKFPKTTYSKKKAPKSSSLTASSIEESKVKEDLAHAFNSFS